MKNNGKSEGFIKPHGYTLKCGDPVVIKTMAGIMIRDDQPAFPHLSVDEPVVAVLVFAQDGREPGSETNLDAEGFRSEINALSKQGAGYLVY